MVDHLQRFVDAQEGVYDRALGELRRGRKTTHWMWFVFPQLRGLGHSAMALEYGIASLEEARDYLADELLGPRLVECASAVIAVESRSAHAIFGSPDDMKFRSSMTLFHTAAPNVTEFRVALDQYFDGQCDAITLRMLGADD